MTELNKHLTDNNVADRQRAIVEAGRLIDLLADELPNVQTIKDQWCSLGLCIRAAIAEIRQSEPASDRIRYESRNGEPLM